MVPRICTFTTTPPRQVRKGPHRRRAQGAPNPLVHMYVFRPCGYIALSCFSRSVWRLLIATLVHPLKPVRGVIIQLCSSNWHLDDILNRIREYNFYSSLLRWSKSTPSLGYRVKISHRLSLFFASSLPQIKLASYCPTLSHPRSCHDGWIPWPPLLPLIRNADTCLH